jgi:hypothetical protein
MSDAHAAKWSGIRTRGRRRYILVSGVLGCGVPAAISSAIVDKFLFEAPGPFVGRLAISLVMLSLGSAWFGKMMWAEGERRYAEWCRRSLAKPAG